MEKEFDKVVKSPFEENEFADLISEERRVYYKGRYIDYYTLCYACRFTGYRFTTTELDEVNLSRIESEYQKLSNDKT